MIELEIMQDASEVIHYDSPLIPFAVQKRKLSDYTDMRALSHWHKDIEWIYIKEGQMCYDINGKNIVLKAGDSLMVNSRQLHFGYDYGRQECHFYVFLFHPDLFECHPDMVQNFVQPVTENPAILFLHLNAATEAAREAAAIFEKLLQTRSTENRTESYRQIGLIYELWALMFEQIGSGVEEDMEDYSEIKLQKQMIRYIYRHYQDTLSLEDIAASGNICRSKCCRIFQKYMKQSPVDFLNSYRLEISRRLLSNTSYSVTQIALSCGYNYVSYYSRAFQKKYNESPKEYRKNHKIPDQQPQI